MEHPFENRFYLDSMDTSLLVNISFYLGCSSSANNFAFMEAPSYSQVATT
jgi:hypothetical protein